MIRINFSILLLFSMFLGTANLVQARTLDNIQKSKYLIVAVDGMTPPFNFYKENKLVGFEIDLIKEIAGRMGLEIKWVVQPFNTLLTALRQDRVDIIAGSHTITPTRSKAVEFIQPHYCNKAVIVSTLKGPRTIADLENKIVSVAVGTVYFDRLKEIHPVQKILTLPSETDGLQALLSGRADAWITEEPIAIGAIKTLEKRTEFQIGEAIMDQKNAMSIAKGNLPLQQAINKELLILIENGTYDRLRKNYLEEDIRCQSKES